jgi:hypothetical protein
MHITSHAASTLLSLLLLSPLITANPVTPNPLHKRALLTMGRCAVFGAIAATTLTNTGATVITGDCGTCPGTSITGFPPGTCTLKESDTTVACNAEADCQTAFTSGVAKKPTCTTLASSNLGGQTLAPGVYCFPTSGVTMTGNLTLNGASNKNGQWVFEIVSTLTTAVGAEVLLENGAQACNAYFLIGSSATLGASGKLQGNFIAYTSITVGAGTSNKGTLAALNAAVNLDDNALNAITSCTL